MAVVSNVGREILYPPSLLQNIPLPEEPFIKWCVDPIGPLTTGSQAIIKNFKRRFKFFGFSVAKFVRRHSALETTKFSFHDNFLKYGFPKIIRFDHDTNFQNNMTKDMKKLLDAEHMMSSWPKPAFARERERQ